MKKKLKKYTPLTKKELREIIDCYATAFPEWEVIGNDRIARINGPILQQIGFEALRSGDYRSSSAVRALSLPTVCMLPQFLNVQHREISRREHPREWKNVVAAMEQQFKPSVRKPLDLREIKKLCEQQARETTNDLCMMAIVSAYLGDDEQAVSCCERMQTLPPPKLAPRLDWEERHKTFGRELRAAIELGKAREFLEWEETEWKRGAKSM